MRTFFIGLFSILLLSHSAQANANENEMAAYIDPVFHPALELFNAGDARGLDRELDSLRRQHGNKADYHYLRGQHSILRMAEVSTIRMPFMARGMRNHWQDAIKADPNHELATMSLAMFHMAAPGIVGGNKDEAESLYQQLVALESRWQHPVNITRLTMQEAPQEELDQAYESMFVAFPKNTQMRLTYFYTKVQAEDWDAANEQLLAIQAVYAERDEVSAEDQALLDYQWGRLAAESGRDLEKGRDLLLGLLADSRLPENIRAEWAHARLAAIFLHLGQSEHAATHVEQARRGMDDDERLAELLNELTAKVQAADS
ncbi:MAG: hypothetical protein JJU10_06260 [Idiomarina sp.]|nr:hypothetical protein [Idiomarina sp.]